MDSIHGWDAQGLRAARGSAEALNGKRRSRGFRGSAHRRWRRRGGVGFWRRADRRRVLSASSGSCPWRCTCGPMTARGRQGCISSWRLPAIGAREAGGTRAPGRTGHGDYKHRHREEESWEFDGDDFQMCTGMATRNEIDEVNAMVCSPSAKDERRRRKNSPELRRSRRSWGRWRSRRRIRVTDPITA
jgi:hypothetical protein